MKMYVNRMILTLLLLPTTTYSNGTPPTENIIRRYNLDTVAATLLPGYLVYRFMSNIAPETKTRNAHDMLHKFYNQLRAFTVEQINYAHDIINMSTQELEKHIHNQAIFTGIGMGLFSGLMYYVITHPVKRTVGSSSSPTYFSSTSWAAAPARFR